MPFTLVLVPGIELFAITEFHVRRRRLNCEFLNLEKYFQMSVQPKAAVKPLHADSNFIPVL